MDLCTKKPVYLLKSYLSPLLSIPIWKVSSRFNSIIFVILDKPKISHYVQIVYI